MTTSYKRTFSAATFRVGSLKAGTWQGKGRVATVMLTPRWLCLGRHKPTRLMYPELWHIPTVPGMEYTSEETRLHYVLNVLRLHYTVEESRLQYDAEEA